MNNGAQGRDRTTDTAIFSRMLYQLSYLGGRPDAHREASQRAVYKESGGLCLATVTCLLNQRNLAAARDPGWRAIADAACPASSNSGNARNRSCIAPPAMRSGRWRPILVVVFGYRDCVRAAQPAMQIDIAAPARTKRFECLLLRFPADRAWRRFGARPDVGDRIGSSNAGGCARRLIRH